MLRRIGLRCGIVLAVITVAAWAIPSRADGQGSFAVVDLANATDVGVISFTIRWGNVEEPGLLAPFPEDGNRRTHRARPFPIAEGEEVPTAQVEFETGIGAARSRQAYTLQSSRRDHKSSDSNCYVFIKQKDDRGEYLVLVRLGTYLSQTAAQATALCGQQQYARAVELCEIALAIDRGAGTTIDADGVPVATARGLAHQGAGKLDEAIRDFTQAIVAGNTSNAFFLRGLAYEAQGKFDQAAADYTRTIELAPQFALGYNSRAWIRATAPEARARDRQGAFIDGSRAYQIDGGKDPNILDTMAAVYAEGGDFPAAVDWQRKAIGLLAQDDAARRKEFDARLALYLAGKPYRSGPAVQAGPQPERKVAAAPAVPPAKERPFPKAYEPYISREAYKALASFRLGQTVDAAENARLHMAYNKAFDEGRFNDTQEANFIRATQREAVAALWKMVDDPAGNRYFLPRFTPVQERLDGMRRPLVGAGADKVVYVESDDDLSGQRIAVRRAPSKPGGGGMETGAILPVKWVKGRGVLYLDPPDNLRVLIRMGKGQHGTLGMSFSLRGKAGGELEIRPEIYTSPKFGDDRFRASSSATVSARGCMDCHGQGFNITLSSFVAPPRSGPYTEFAAAVRKMPGVDGFLADAKKHGASDEEMRVAERVVTRPDVLLRSARMKHAVLRLWNAIYDENQPYLDDADTRFVEYHDTYGSAWLDAGDPGKALGHFDLAISRNSGVAMLFTKRALASTRLDRYPEAASDLDKAIGLDPRNAFSYVLRTDISSRTGDYRRCKEDAEQAVRLAPNWDVGHAALARAEFYQGHYRRAAEEIYVAIRANPEEPFTHAYRAWVLSTAPDASLRDGDEAVREATKAYELSAGKLVRFRQQLAAAHAEAGHFAEAVKWQEEALKDPRIAKPALEEQRKGFFRTLDDGVRSLLRNCPDLPGIRGAPRWWPGLDHRECGRTTKGGHRPPRALPQGPAVSRLGQHPCRPPLILTRAAFVPSEDRKVRTCMAAPDRPGADPEGTRGAATAIGHGACCEPRSHIRLTARRSAEYRHCSQSRTISPQTGYGFYLIRPSGNGSRCDACPGIQKWRGGGMDVGD